jgi:hypothetical protein
MNEIEEKKLHKISEKKKVHVAPGQSSKEKIVSSKTVKLFI